MQVNGKEYIFRERVVIGQLLKVEQLRKGIDLSFLSAVNGNIVSRLKEYFQWRKVNKLWFEMCNIVFENADSGLKLQGLTPQEVQAIPENFFAFIETKQKTLSEIFEDSKEEIP